MWVEEDVKGLTCWVLGDLGGEDCCRRCARVGCWCRTRGRGGFEDLGAALRQEGEAGMWTTCYG